jgi:predicted ATPase
LIGKNGSGKSSILEWINKNKQNIHQSSEIIDHIKKISYNNDNNLRLPQKTQKITTKAEFDRQKVKFQNSKFCEANKILKENGFYGQKEIESQDYKEYEEIEGDKVLTNLEFRLSNVYKREEEATGFWILRELIHRITTIYSSGMSDLNEFVANFIFIQNNSYFYILIEEVENGLHPSFQKQIPLLLNSLRKNYLAGIRQTLKSQFPSTLPLNEWRKSLLSYFRQYHYGEVLKEEKIMSEITPEKLEKFLETNNPIKFLITTHSPFIVSSSANFPDSQKVYLIEDGECLNPNGNTGKDIKHMAAKMVGAEIKDLTPSKVVFCAESEKIFLELINQAFYNLDIIFVKPNPDGGDITVLKLAENTGKFANNFYPDSEIFYYLDKQKDNNSKNKVTSLQKQKEFKLIISNKESFEAKFGSQIIKNENKNVKFKNGKNEEKILSKVDHAKYQADFLIRIQNGKREFEKKFEELKEVFCME